MGTVFALPRSRHARTVLMCGKLQGELSKVSTRGRLLCCCEANIQGLSSCAANCKENFRRLAHKVTVLLCRLRGSRITIPVCFLCSSRVRSLRLFARASHIVRVCGIRPRAFARVPPPCAQITDYRALICAELFRVLLYQGSSCGCGSSAG